MLIIKINKNTKFKQFLNLFFKKMFSIRKQTLFLFFLLTRLESAEKQIESLDSYEKNYQVQSNQKKNLIKEKFI